MSAHFSASKLAAQKAAASFLVNDDDTPYHDSRPVARLPLDDDCSVVVPLAQAVPHVTEPDSVSHLFSSTAEEGPSYETGKDAAWMERRKSGHSTQLTNHSGTHTSYYDSHHGTGLNSASWTDDGSMKNPRTPPTHCISTTDKRHIERLALPRGAQGSGSRPAEPNYGHLLNFTDEEERERHRVRQHSSKSPRTRPSPIMPRLEETQATRIQPPLSRPESKHHTAVSNGALSPAQKAYYEKLAAPKKCPPASAADGSTPGPVSSTAAARRRSNSSSFDRLAMPKKPFATCSEESMPPTGRQSHSHSSCAHVLTPQQQDRQLQRLSKPKHGSASSHRDVCAPVEPKLPTSKKCYYGGTTAISVSPGTPISSGLALTSPHPNGRHNGRVPNASWEAAPSYLERRPLSTVTSCSVLSGSCTQCGSALPQQVLTVSSQRTVSNTVAPQEATVEQRVVSSHKPHPTAAANGDGVRPVQSAPAKSTGTKPPIVVRTRRYVPPSEEQDTEAAGQSVSRTAMQESPAAPGPKPVEAVRRRPATPTVLAETTMRPILEKEQQKMADVTSLETSAHGATAPVVAQATKRAPPPASSVSAEVNEPKAGVQATKRLPPASASTAVPPAPQKPAMSDASERHTPAPCTAPSGTGPSRQEARPQPGHVSSTNIHPSPSSASFSASASDKATAATPQAGAVTERNGTFTAASASAMDDMRAVPTARSSDSKGPRKIMHRKPKSAKPEVLRDSDFAFQLEALPGQRQTVSIEKPKTMTKRPVKAPPPKSH
ncbi:hypothetical protein, unknown function [Leishmania tarentolae]|uniref:Uncharacterized protein n=1 Tax=Leishmania tarentolae TaxID=5689 RepID=A0A640KN96_LEITA|nr:hypothetical protein, unknown function [Leishmania tarentolae]